MHPMLALVWMSTAVWGQSPFQNLAPNGDGSVLYFSSALRLTGTDQYAHEKIFVWEQGGGVRLYAQRPPTIEFLLLGASYSSPTQYRLLAAALSSDGDTVALTGVSDCNFGSRCALSVKRYEVEVSRGGHHIGTFDGTGSLSPNGGYLLLGSSPMFPLAAPPLDLVDLRSGGKRQVNTNVRPPFRHGVADDGSTVASRDGIHLLLSGETGEQHRIPANPVAGSTRINASGSRVFLIRYPDTGATPLRLAIFDAGATTVRDIGNAESAFDISDDGNVAAWVDGGRLQLARAPSFAPQLIPTPSPADTVTVSGDGTKLFIVTADYAIVRFDLQTGTHEEIVPPTPSPALSWKDSMKAPAFGVVARGSAYSLAAVQVPPIAALKFNGERWPVLSADNEQISFQVPWDAALGAGHIELVLEAESRSPFESAIILWPMNVVDRFPAFYQVSPQLLAALHQDFSGLVTAERPARSGEVIHLFGTGFGRATSAADGLSRLDDAWACSMAQSGTEKPVELLFAGLAPTLIGINQLDVRLPGELQPGDAFLTCRCIAEPCGTGGILPVAP